jgi:hypothetical protein
LRQAAARIALTLKAALVVAIAGYLPAVRRNKSETINLY